MDNQFPTLTGSTTPKEVSAASTLFPFRKDDDRSRYLGYLCCGFSVEEALYMIGKTVSWLEEARLDDRFSITEERMPEYRVELSREYSELDFLRNFRMVMEKDHRVLRTSLGMEVDPSTGEIKELTDLDQSYLLKMRGAYTPQQLQLLQSIALGEDRGASFAKWVQDNQEVITMSRTQSVTISRGRDAKA